MGSGRGMFGTLHDATGTTPEVAGQWLWRTAALPKYAKERRAINDEEALNAFRTLTRVEGIIPALESSHAIAYAMKLAKTMQDSQRIIVSLSGRGDKDMHTVASIDGLSV